jgi:hypothetical protein
MATDSGLTATAINPAGLTPENLAKYEEALKASMDALQARYANPNWFNVAAGFLKPQLGGFAASLGSAGAALGDWQEKQRANELPVAQMRAQLGLVGMQQEQKNQADARYAQAMARGGFTEADVAYIAARDKQKGEQAAEAFDRAKGIKIARGNRAETLASSITGRPASVSQQQVDFTPGFESFNGQGVKFGAPSDATPVVATPAPVPGAAPPVLGAPPAPSVDFQVPEIPGGLTPAQASKKTETQVAETLKFTNQLTDQVAEIPKRYGNLSTAYDLLNDPNVQKVLGRTRTGGVSAILQAGLTSDSSPDAVKKIVSLLVNPDTTKDIKPIKDAKGNNVPGGSVKDQIASLNEKIGMLASTAAQEQLNINQMMKSPTDYSRAAERNLAINLDDTARSNQRKITTALHDMSRTTRLSDVVQKLKDKNLGYSDLIANPEYKKVEEAWAKEHNVLAKTALRETLPTELRYPFKPVVAPAAPGAAGTTSSIVQQLRANAARTAAPTP